MRLSIFIPLAFSIYLGGCASSTHIRVQGTFYWFYKPSTEDCSTLPTDSAIQCVLGAPFKVKDLRNDFRKCTRMHKIKGMTFDEFDETNSTLIDCMQSFGWDLQGATV